MWFDSFWALARVLAVGSTIYVLLVVVLRLSGKRTLSKLSAFDLVVTVAMGSALSSALLSAEVKFATAALGIVVLVGMQYGIAKLSVKWPRFASLVRAQPRLLLENGQWLDGNLHRERITRSEVLAALRGAGVRRVEHAAAVVLETDGTLSVLRSTADAPPDVLDGVQR